MKKLLAVLLLSMAGFTAFAQSGLGIKGGLGLTNVYTDAGSLKGNIQQSLDTKTGFVFGVWGRLGKKLYLQPELLVASKGGKVEVTPLGMSTPQLVDVKYTNLDIPILVGFKPLNFLRVMAGPVASVKLSEDKKLKDALGDFTSNTGDAFASSTWGYQFGVGVKLLGIEIDLRREGGLSDINVLKFKDNANFSQRPAGWQLTLGFKII